MKIQSLSTFVPVAADADAEPPPYAPPYDPAFDVKLPSRQQTDQRLEQERARQPASARQDSAVAALQAGGGPGSNPFVVLGEPPAARLLAAAPQDAGIIVIGGTEASGIDSPLDTVALNPQPLPPRDAPSAIDEPSVASARPRPWSR